MGSISTEAKVGLFVLVALIILGYMSFRVGQYGFGLKKGYTVNAVFDNVAGLNKDADVMIAGVEVGKVEGIGLKDGRALVTMRIVPAVRLEKDVVVTIKTHGILGDKYIEIVPGTRGNPSLSPARRSTGWNARRIWTSSSSNWERSPTTSWPSRLPSERSWGEEGRTTSRRSSRTPGT